MPKTCSICKRKLPKAIVHRNGPLNICEYCQPIDKRTNAEKKAEQDANFMTALRQRTGL